MRRLILALLALTSLGACATSDPGWRGSAPQTHQSAHTACMEEVRNLPPVSVDRAFDDCMARRGWTH